MRYTGHAGWFAPLATVLFRRLFIIAVSLDVTNQTFFFAHFLEALDHLLNTFTRTWLNLNHTNTRSFPKNSIFFSHLASLPNNTGLLPSHLSSNDTDVNAIVYINTGAFQDENTADNDNFFIKNTAAPFCRQKTPFPCHKIPLFMKFHKKNLQKKYAS